MSDTSVFNPDQFLGQSTEAAGSTQYFPVPIGDYRGQVLSITGRQIVSQKEATMGNKYTLLEIVWHVLGEEAQQATATERPTARQSIFVDLTPSGGLDFGKNKNVPLSRLRDAFGQNRQGRQWAPSHMVGQTAMIRVEHEVNAETGEPRATVRKAVAA